MDGLPMPGSKVEPNGILVHKSVPCNITDTLANPDMPDNGYKSSPLSYKSPIAGYVDRVLITNSAAKQLLVKVPPNQCCEGRGGRAGQALWGLLADPVVVLMAWAQVLMRQTRRPELGDKFSSRHGQKGVCGLIVPQENMPFSDSGVCPDLIMNPHGFPSRMTVGKMIELLAGKAGALDGNRRYGTAFAGDSVASCATALVKSGYHYAGKDYLTSGMSCKHSRRYTPHTRTQANMVEGGPPWQASLGSRC